MRNISRYCSFSNMAVHSCSSFMIRAARDTILFEIEWPEDRGQSLFRFNDVYWTSFNLNFGIISRETVLHATVLDADNEDLRNFYSGWKGLMDEVKLDAYEIELNSTGGRIKIIAKGFTEESL